MIGAKMVDRFISEETRLELNGDAFALMSELLDYHSATLVVTRASVGDRIVAIVKRETVSA